MRLFPRNADTAAVWVWDLSVGSPRSIVADACAAGANTLYVSAYPLFPENAVRLRALLDAAVEQHLKVELLVGAPDWVDPGQRDWLRIHVLSPLSELLGEFGYQDVALHLDVEPHVEGEMTAERMTAFLAMLTFVREEIRGACALNVDLPVWYASLSLHDRSFAEQILERIDGVTLMVYGREAGAVVEAARPWLTAAAACAKSVVVGVEVGPEHDGVGLDSQRSVAARATRIDVALNDKARYPAYAGVALHDFARVRELPREP